jgi:hypothetical protein
MTGAKPIKRRRSPRPPRPPRTPFSAAERLRNIDQGKMFFREVVAKLKGKGYIQTKLDNGEIDAATAAKLREQVEIDAKTTRRTGNPWFDAKLAEVELSWTEKGCAPPADLWWYLLCVGDLPVEALRTILAALEAQMGDWSEIKKRWFLVRFCRDRAHKLRDQPPMKRLTWPESYEEAAKIWGVSPDTMKKSYASTNADCRPSNAAETSAENQGKKNEIFTLDLRQR